MISSMKKLVLITGAASGIGRATAEKYLQCSQFNIIAVDSNDEGIADFCRAVDASLRHRLHPVVVDLTDYDAVSQAIAPLIAEYGGVDHVVISHAVSSENHIDENAKWDFILEVNLRSVQRLLSLLHEDIKDGGRVVVLSSILGRAGKIMNSGYVASKHALLGLVKALALDWARRKITVNAVLPCWVDTPMLRQELKQQAAMLGIPVENMLKKIRKQIPLRALITADDVAEVIYFLSSPAANMITAQSLVVDGGYGCGA